MYTDNLMSTFVRRFLEEILDYTMRLISIQYVTDLGGPALISPMHILSLIDTKANWFIKWMVCLITYV